MRVRPRWALALAAVALASAAAYVETRQETTTVAPAELRARAAVPVTIAVVTKRYAPIVVHALGTVQPIETVNVQSRVNGQIMEAYFTQGQTVKKGDPLFLVDPRAYQAALDQALPSWKKMRPCSPKPEPISHAINGS